MNTEKIAFDIISLAGDAKAELQAALKLAEEHDLPLVATNDVVFLAPDDFEAHEIRVAIHDGYTLDDMQCCGK